MAHMIHETKSFAVLTMRVGLLIRDKRRCKETYIQPGDDTSAMLSTLKALEELPDRKIDALFDMIVSEYVD